VEAVPTISHRQGRAPEKSAAGKAQTTARGAHDEPEILEGLARDIVSRLATTLFAEDEAPSWRRDSVPEEATPPGPISAGEGESKTPSRAEGGEASETARMSRRVRPPECDRPALLVRGTVRSGRQVRHNGDVVVLGDVNPGGQIVAAGDVAVMGTVRGTVHAGATGDHSAVVAAFRLCPTQLRIASYVSRPPEDPGGHPEYPELALVRDGVVVVQPLTSGSLTRSGPDETLPGRGGGQRKSLIGKQ